MNIRGLEKAEEAWKKNQEELKKREVKKNGIQTTDSRSEERSII